MASPWAGESLYSVKAVKHDDVIKWRHFRCCWPFVRWFHLSPVNSPRKGQWRGAFVFSSICTWTNNWANSGDATDLRPYRVHYDVTVMISQDVHIDHNTLVLKLTQICATLFTGKYSRIEAFIVKEVRCTKLGNGSAFIGALLWAIILHVHLHVHVCACCMTHTSWSGEGG